MGLPRGRAKPPTTWQSIPLLHHPGDAEPQSSPWWGVTSIPRTPSPPQKKKPTIQTNNGGKIPQPSSPCRAEHEALPSLGVPTRPAFRRSIAAATAADAQAERSAGHPRQPPPKKAKGLFPTPPPHTHSHTPPPTALLFLIFFFSVFLSYCFKQVYSSAWRCG